MNSKYLKVNLTFLFFALLMQDILSQTLIVNRINNTNQAFNLSQIQKITFDSTEILIHSMGGSSNEFGLNEINYIYFDENFIGMNELTNSFSSHKLLIYPNPSESEFTLKFDNFSENNVKMEVFDINGNLLLERMVKNTTNHEEKLRLENLSSGIYHLRITSSNLIQHKTIIKK
jgi:hypothetical protein